MTIETRPSGDPADLATLATNATDTVVELYRDEVFVDTNDDGEGIGVFSRLEHTAEEAGRYGLRIMRYPYEPFAPGISFQVSLVVSEPIGEAPRAGTQADGQLSRASLSPRSGEPF